MNFVPLATSAGPRRALPPPPLVLVQMTAEDRRLFAAWLDSRAKGAEQAGDFAEADRLATRAAAVRP